ncbi:FAD-binding domain-containing protein [Mycena crocata]|nr:FAD-binding domain-containing protein [Mycena crocata]
MLLDHFLVYITSLVVVSAQDPSSSASANDVSGPQIGKAASLACDSIRFALGSSIVESSGAEYNATAQGPWSLFNSLDQPTCIVYPRSASDVQIAMKQIVKFGSHYAVQSGAHSAMVGWNSISDGVLIAFTHMKNASYSPATDTITVQPGVHWGDVMTAVEPYGVSVVGGRSSDVGTGLLLGGGISFVSPLYGWSADLIKEIDVVLVTGQLLTATATNEYSDLFVALKGGANRFGIVTRYELYPAHTGNKDQKDWFGGLLVLPGSASEAVSNASARYVREVTDPNAGLMVVMNTKNLTDVAANIIYLFYKGAELPERIFGDFLAIPPTFQSLSPLSYFDISNMIPGGDRGNGQQFGSSSWVGDEATFWEGYNHLANFTKRFDSDLFASLMVISPVPRSAWTARQSAGPKAFNDPGVAYASMNFNIVHSPGVTTLPKGVDEGFRFLLTQTPPSPGLPLFISECDPSQNVYETYSGFAALQKTYAKYDPHRFIVEHTVGPNGL